MVPMRWAVGGESVCMHACVCVCEHKSGHVLRESAGDPVVLPPAPNVCMSSSALDRTQPGSGAALRPLAVIFAVLPGDV